MLEHNGAPWRLVCVVLALVFFGIAGFYWPEPLTPHRGKLVAIGLFFWVLSTFL